MHTSSKILAGAALATAFLAFSPTQAQAVTMTLLGDYCGGQFDDSAVCSELGVRYEVSGGAVVDPAEDIQDRAATPGSDTDDGAAADQVLSYNVVSVKETPEPAVGDATDPIVVSGLNGTFEFYWGSVDSFNLVEFFSGGIDGTKVDFFTGTDVADKYNEGRSEDDRVTENAQGSYDFDQYVRFTGNFDSAHLSIDELTGKETGVAFEVATKVPEPAAIALLGLGLLSLGLIRIRTRSV